ncbi:hypothetical protein ACIQ7N_20265 [Lysinibacillus sp. NPDC095746]|uniref:hypothetical protein n=1 Tax=Lysinibacillus sp. NPDC095746 TaxID=3364134 RepID=UPI0038071C55
MNFQDLMKFKGSIYLNKLFKPEENSLRVLIDRCNVNNIKGFVKITDKVEIEASSEAAHRTPPGSFAPQKAKCHDKASSRNGNKPLILLKSHTSICFI